MTREFPNAERDLKFAPYVTAICLIAICVSFEAKGVFSAAFAWGPPLGLLQFVGALRDWKSNSSLTTTMSAVMTFGVCMGVTERHGSAWDLAQMIAVASVFGNAPMIIWRSRIREWLQTDPR